MFNQEEILKRVNGGPFGYGEPENRKLLPIERTRIIPVYKRDIIVRDYCLKEDDEYNACCQNYPGTQIFRCRQEKSSFKGCIDKHWTLPHLMEQAEEEYLKDRSAYRLTGSKKNDCDQRNQSKLKLEKN